MAALDRRVDQDRRGLRAANAVALGAALSSERRERTDRRGRPRRRADARDIADYAYSIAAGETRLEVIVDGSEGLRLVAMFECGCVAVEPVGAGATRLTVETCAAHKAQPVANERRRGERGSD